MSRFSPMRAAAPSRSPSKKIIPLVAICLVIIALAFIFLFYNPKAAAKPSGTLGVVNQAQVSGLADSVYQKIQADLLQLATSTPDSAQTTTPTTPKTTAPAAPLTATEALSQDFINQYIAIKQSGQTMSADQMNSLIPNLIQNGNATRYIPQAQIFTGSDIHISADSSAAALHTYGNAVGAIFAKNAVPKNLNELDIFQAAVNSGNPNDLAQLAIILKSYSGIEKGLLATPVPASAAPLHLALINDFSQAINCITGMQKLFSDPVFTVAAIQNYEQVAPAVYNDLTAFGLLFAKSGVTFAPTEPGRALISSSN